MRETLTADEARNLEEGTYIVVKLQDQCYWKQGEGRVTTTVEYDSGAVHVVFRGSRGHENRLKIPADARKTWKSDGAASGARNLPVDHVERLPRK
jgi:hypothetical protein